MFKKGTRLIFKNNNQPAYEKLGDKDDAWWVCLYGNYWVKEHHLNPESGELEEVHVKYSESDLPLFRKDGSLNRSGFRWTDEMVQRWYGDIMIFNFDGVV
jgi:hypothetical protein